MKKCPYCNAENLDDATICANCGSSLNTVKPDNFSSNQSGSHSVASGNDSYGAWWLLGFVIPLVGLILFIVWRSDYPLRSKSAGIGALVSVILSILGSIIWSVIYVVFILGAAGVY